MTSTVTPSLLEEERSSNTNSDDDDVDSNDEDDDNQSLLGEPTQAQPNSNSKDTPLLHKQQTHTNNDPGGNLQDNNNSPKEESDTKKKKKDKKPLGNKLFKEAIKLKNEISQRGVLYFSGFPTSMRPRRLKDELGQFGVVTRTYLKPINPGKRFQIYKCGWAEMETKKLARKVARILNGTPIHPKKEPTLWNVRYLPGFSWMDLIEAGKAQDRLAELKLKTSLARAKREANFFLDNVAADEEFESRQRSRNKRKRKRVARPNPEPNKKFKRTFRQETVDEKEQDPKELGDSFLKELIGGE